MPHKFNPTEEQVRAAVVGSRSIAGVLRKLHLSHQGSNYRRVKVLISREAEIDV